MKKLYILLLAFVALVFAGQANANPGMKSNRNMEISAGYSNMTTSGNYNVAEKYNLDGFYVGFAYSLRSHGAFGLFLQESSSRTWRMQMLWRSSLFSGRIL